MANWYRVVDIIQTVLRYIRIQEKCAWKVVVLLPKGNGYFQGIGLVEVILKEV